MGEPNEGSITRNDPRATAMVRSRGLLADIAEENT